MSHKATLLGAAASIALLASVLPASAGHFNGWYLGVEGGASWVEDNKFDFGTGPSAHPPLTSFNNAAEYDTGWAVLATVGYGFGMNIRAEFEAGWRQNDVSLFTSGPGHVPFRDATLDELTLMANVLYDIPIGSRLMLTVGAGAGGDDARIDDGVVKDDDWRFAYQGIVGLSYAIGSRTDITLNYHYLRASGPDYSHVHHTLTTHFDRESFDDLVKHTVTIGLRYDLWPDAVEEPMAPEAPPPPPPAAEPAQSFMIFFGFNKCNITPEADNVLSQAAEAAHQMGHATIKIVGHTDTMGSNQYNQKLSECRAHAAKSNLVGKGIPDGTITTMGKGETELLVQTADHVKEPQNRRATIDLQ
jgi:outer membrane protein OmpA-like peptidoglycan-associated protein